MVADQRQTRSFVPDAPSRADGLARWLTWSPVLLAAILMIPRLASAQFGLFDDARTVSVARQVVSGDWSGIWEASSARSRPVYWLFYSLIYSLAGLRPFWFFVGNALVLAAVTALIVWFVRSITGNGLQSALAGSLFVLSAPAAESFYTLSKPEVAQILWLAGFGVAAYGYGRASRWQGRVAAAVAMILMLLLADLTKEVSVVMVPICLGWILMARLGRSRMSPGRVLAATIAFALASLVATAVYLILRSSFAGLGLPAGTYGAKYSLSLAALLPSSIRWAGWVARDFLYLAPLALMWLLLGAKLDQAQRTLLAGSLIWMGGWCAIYVPWMYASEYYLLPFALGAAVFGGIILGRAVQEARSRASYGKAWLWATLVMSAIAIGASFANAATDARIQLAVDEQNSSLLDFLASRMPPRAAVIINIQDPNEYEVEIRWHLSEMRGRSDLSMDYFRSQPEALEAGTYIVAPLVRNMPLQSVRMGVIEPVVDQWNDSLLGFVGPRTEPVYTQLAHVRLLIVNVPRLFCPISPGSSYCGSREPVVDTRMFSYGWIVYQVQSGGLNGAPG